MSGEVQSNQPINLPDAAYTVSPVDSGKIMFVNTVTANRTYTLPLPAAGLHYRFINKAPGALGGNVIIATNGGAAIMNGIIIQVGAAVNATRSLPVAGSVSNTFVTAVSLIGDCVDVYSDGTSWFVQSLSTVNGGITSP